MNRRRIIAILWGALCSAVFTLSALAGEGIAPQTPDPERADGLLLPLTLFRKFISPVDGERCSMAPSCSRYALDAFHKQGAILGWIMTSDRLMRCGRDEITHAHPIRIGPKTYSLDPIENNDFWLEDPGQPEQDQHEPSPP